MMRYPSHNQLRSYFLHPILLYQPTKPPLNVKFRPELQRTIKASQLNAIVRVHTQQAWLFSVRFVRLPCMLVRLADRERRVCFRDLHQAKREIEDEWAYDRFPWSPSQRRTGRTKEESLGKIAWRDSSSAQPHMNKAALSRIGLLLCCPPFDVLFMADPGQRVFRGVSRLIVQDIGSVWFMELLRVLGRDRNMEACISKHSILNCVEDADVISIMFPAMESHQDITK